MREVTPHARRVHSVFGDGARALALGRRTHGLPGSSVAVLFRADGHADVCRTDKIFLEPLFRACPAAPHPPFAVVGNDVCGPPPRVRQDAPVLEYCFPEVPRAHRVALLMCEELRALSPELTTRVSESGPIEGGEAWHTYANIQIRHASGGSGEAMIRLTHVTITKHSACLPAPVVAVIRRAELIDCRLRIEERE